MNTQLTLHVPVNMVQEESFISDTEIGGGEDAMVYGEFIEGLCAVAAFKMCSPYISVARRCVYAQVHRFVASFYQPLVWAQLGQLHHAARPSKVVPTNSRWEVVPRQFHRGVAQRSHT